MTNSNYSREDLSKFSRLLIPKGNLDDLLGAELGERYYEYRRRWERAALLQERPPFPLNIDFELNSSCNLKCPMCTWSAEVALPGKASWMDFGLFKEIIDHSVPQGLCSVGFDWINEPLIRRDLPDFVAYARDAGIIDSIIHTNGTVLSRPTSERLVDAGLTRMMVSLDAFTKGTYDRIRVGAKMDRVLKNIHQFLDVRAQKGSRLPLLAVNFVLMSLNEHELNDFVEYWSPYVDLFSIQQYTNPFEEKTDAQDLFFAKSREKLTNFRCQQPWLRMTVRYDGQVLPCCSFYADKLVMGNVHSQTIKEIWDSPQMRQLQAMHASGEYYNNPICKQCAENTVVSLEPSHLAAGTLR